MKITNLKKYIFMVIFYIIYSYNFYNYFLIHKYYNYKKCYFVIKNITMKYKFRG